MTLTRERRGLYEVQLWEMRNVGLDSDVWVIGEGPINYWGPMRFATAARDYGWACAHRALTWERHKLAHPMLMRWIRA